MPAVILPGKRPGEHNITIDDARTIVIVGANGAGKTRLGSFIEQQATDRTHRVSAQRSLMIPDFVQPRAYEQAEKTFRWGIYQPAWDDRANAAQKVGHRWSSQPATAMLNDYEHVLALLFAEEAKRNRDYTRAAIQALPGETAPKCKLDKLASIWSVVMPQRVLTILDDRVKATASGGDPYDGKQMSDGERVAIYLMGQVLCALSDSVIVIDEPEIHLHRAIQGLLWDQLEAARTDCTFVYITHDLDFAATRVNARRIWLKEFDGTAWTWEELGTLSPLPDVLAMQILGARRPILFVEGDATSHDASIYTALYPREHVVPRESCEKVVEATKAMAALPAFHHVRVRGLVDRDRRSDDEINALKLANVFVADVAEVENLLCIPEAISAVAGRLGRDPAKAIAEAADALFGELRKQIAHQALSRALAEIQFRLSGFGPSVSRGGAEKLQSDLSNYVGNIDVMRMVEMASGVFDDILARRDYMGALRFFNCKGNVSFVARPLQISVNSYVSTILHILKSEPTGSAANAMRELIGG